MIYPKFEQKWPGKYLKVVDVGILRAYNFGLSSELSTHWPMNWLDDGINYEMWQDVLQIWQN